MKEENVGTVKISEDVIASIANLAACEVDGVAKLVVKTVANIKSAVPSFKNPVKGVCIANGADGLELTLQIAVKQGFKIQNVAKHVQDNVAEAVSNMTGQTVKAVNVVVVGLVEEKKPETKENKA